jgi:sphinganine C4-monooxygenase
MASNVTSLTGLPPLPSYVLKPLPPLVFWIPDAYLSLLLPVLAYWAVSLFFHIIDVYDLFPQYRLHTPAELLKRNHASRWDVFRDVVIQQVVQTIFGVVVAAFEPDTLFGKEEYNVAVWAQRIRMAQRELPLVLSLVGVNAGELGKRLAESRPMLAGALVGGQYPFLQQVMEINGERILAPSFARWEMQVAKLIYWFLAPAVQFLVAITIVDTWQYFLHRAMHMNHFLYSKATLKCTISCFASAYILLAKFHSRHHRLYVPYAYGALYNHPVEGFVLDTLGTIIAYLVSGMTARQSMWFFTCSTIKTVDDHCGYALPWDPLQHITSNNAAYHDIHHQSWGIKTNFSQPFFTVWDRAFKTMWRGGDVKLRYESSKQAADAWWQDQSQAALKVEEEEEVKANGAVEIPSLSNPSQADDQDSVSMSSVRRSPRKKMSGNNQSSLKGLKDRVSGSLPNATVPRVESRR